MAPIISALPKVTPQNRLLASAAPVDPGPAPVTYSGNPFVAPSLAPVLSAIPTQQAAPSQAIADVNELHRLQSTGSGVSQIQNPWLRGVARVADALGTFVAPNITRNIGGTTLHHQDLEREQGRIVAVDQANALADQHIRNQQAQADQSVASTAHLNAETDSLLHPDPTPGKLVIGGDGSAAGYQDGKGNYLPLTDAAVPAGARAVAANIAGKPANVASADKPIDAQEAAARNALWDKLAAKHGLPTGQFTTGMTRAEANNLANNLSSVVGKQQGDTHVTISMAGMQDRRDQRAANNASTVSPDALALVANGQAKLQDIFGRGTSTQQKAAILADIKRINPNFNSGDHDLENKARGYFTSGQGGQTLNAGNTLTHHLDLYEKAATAMHNGDVVALNRIGNELGIQLGKDTATNMRLIARGVASEAARFYTQGVPGETEIEGFLKDLSPNGSEAQMHSGAATVRGMARGKLDSLRTQYQQSQQGGQPNFYDAGGSNAGAPVERYVRVNGKLVKQ